MWGKKNVTLSGIVFLPLRPAYLPPWLRPTSSLTGLNMLSPFGSARHYAAESLLQLTVRWIMTANAAERGAETLLVWFCLFEKVRWHARTYLTGSWEPEGGSATGWR